MVSSIGMAVFEVLHNNIWGRHVRIGQQRCAASGRAPARADFTNPTRRRPDPLCPAHVGPDLPNRRMYTRGSGTRTRAWVLGTRRAAAIALGYSAARSLGDYFASNKVGAPFRRPWGARAEFRHSLRRGAPCARARRALA